MIFYSFRIKKVIYQEIICDYDVIYDKVLFVQSDFFFMQIYLLVNNLSGIKMLFNMCIVGIVKKNFLVYYDKILINFDFFL